MRTTTSRFAVHLVAALPILGFGLFLHATGTQPSTLAVFLAAYAAYSLAIGLVLPMWQNYTGLGAWSYRIVFLAMAAVSAVGPYFSARMVAEPSTPG